MSGFGVGEQRWIEGLDKLRNVIRQEVIGRQLADHVSPGMSVLDVGCGQGTQALRLASHGCHVTGVDPSPELLDCFASGASTAGLDVELIEGRIEDLDELLPQRRFDVVCAHGLLVRIFNDAIPADTVVPDDGELALLLDAEDLAGRHDPYRWMGARLHVVAAAL
ncbi:MAG: class I SAM-dependent methyltransferase [Microthrixaceae bacterium]